MAAKKKGKGRWKKARRPRKTKGCDPKTATPPTTAEAEPGGGSGEPGPGGGGPL